MKPWHTRFLKYGATTTILWWLIRAPLIFLLTEILPLQVWFIPPYLTAAFIVGVTMTLIHFTFNEGWIWKH